MRDILFRKEKRESKRLKRKKMQDAETHDERLQQGDKSSGSERNVDSQVVSKEREQHH